MRKFTLLLVAALLTATSFAQTTQRGQRHPQNGFKVQAGKLDKKSLQRNLGGIKPQENLLRKTQAEKIQAIAKAPRRAASYGITEQPAGKAYENAIYAFSGYAYSWFYGLYDSSSDAEVATIVEGNDGNIYIKGLTPSLYVQEEYWIKAEKGVGDTIIIKQQPAGIYAYSDGTVEVDYIAGLKNEPYVDEDDGETYVDYVADGDGSIKLLYKDGVLKSTDKLTSTGTWPDYAVGILYTYDEDGVESEPYWDYSLYWNLSIQQNPETITELPAGAVAENLILKYKQVDNIQAKEIPVYISDTEVYFKPYEDVDGYIKGTIEGNKVIVKNGQYVGVDGYYGGHTWAHTATIEKRHYEDEDDPENSYDYDYGTINAQIEFSYDAAAKVLKAEDGAIYIDGAKDRIYYADYYNLPEIYKFNEVAATPADPDVTYFYNYDEDYEYGVVDFDIPNVDVDGNYITPSKLSYVVYFDDEVFEFDPEEYYVDEALTEIPYSFDNDYDITKYGSDKEIYFFFEVAENVGVQSIYRGAGVEKKSNIVFYDIATDATYTVSGIKNVVNTGAKSVAAEAYYDATGRKVAAGTKGFVIKTVTFADGTKKSYKFVRK